MTKVDCKTAAETLKKLKNGDHIETGKLKITLCVLNETMPFIRELDDRFHLFYAKLYNEREAIEGYLDARARNP